MADDAVTAGQVSQFISLTNGMKREDLQFLFNSGFLSDLLKADARNVERDDLREALRLPTPEKNGAFRLTVDYRRSLLSAIDAIGLTVKNWEFDGGKETLASLKPPHSGVHKVVARLDEPTNEELENHHLLAKRFRDRSWCRPANIWEMLAFCERYPQRARAIIAYATFVRMKRGSKSYLAVPMVEFPDDTTKKMFPERTDQFHFAGVRNAGWCMCKFLTIDL